MPSAAHNMKSDGAIIEKVFQIGALAAEVLGYRAVIGNVLEAIDRPLHDSLTVPQWADVDQGGETSSIRPLDHYLCIAGSNAGSERGGHRTIFQSQRRAVTQKETMRAAKAITVRSEHRSSSP